MRSSQEQPYQRIAVDVDPLERDPISLKELTRIGGTGRRGPGDQVLNAH
jgi:hypothetical protein